MTNELIKAMLDSIEIDQPAQAQEHFNDILSMKLTDALDQRKQEVAQQLGNLNADV